VINDLNNIKQIEKIWIAQALSMLHGCIHKLVSILLKHNLSHTTDKAYKIHINTCRFSNKEKIISILFNNIRFGIRFATLLIS